MMNKKSNGEHPGLIRCSECGLLFDASFFFALKKSRGKVCLYCRQDKDLAYSRKFHSTDHGKNYGATAAYCNSHGFRVANLNNEQREVLMQSRQLNRVVRRLSK